MSPFRDMAGEKVEVPVIWGHPLGPEAIGFEANITSGGRKYYVSVHQQEGMGIRGYEVFIQDFHFNRETRIQGYKNAKEALISGVEVVQREIEK